MTYHDEHRERIVELEEQNAALLIRVEALEAIKRGAITVGIEVRNERDSARRELCHLLFFEGTRLGRRETVEEYAAIRGWQYLFASEVIHVWPTQVVD
jgi:hypothetical protein